MDEQLRAVLEQIGRLDQRLGIGVGARKERDRLERQLRALKDTRESGIDPSGVTK